VDITTLDLNGKVVAEARHLLEKGTHLVAIPRHAAGVYLCRLRAGSDEILLKDRLVGESPRATSAAASGSPLDGALRRQLATAATINDVIAVTKAGYLDYRVMVTNSDTSGIQIRMILCADTVRDVDGNLYQAVRLGNQVWTVQNLRTTNHDTDSTLRRVNDPTEWSNLTTGAYCFYDTTTDTAMQRICGALYNWYAVNAGRLSPAGWHLPTSAEWVQLVDYLTTSGYNWDGTTSGNKVGKSVAAQTYWDPSSTAGAVANDVWANNRSGLTVLAAGYRRYNGGFYLMDNAVGLWSTTPYDSLTASCRYLRSDFVDLQAINLDKKFGFCVRLVKD
jgi:uncharacterized protein (TIGR02145 family)